MFLELTINVNQLPLFCVYRIEVTFSPCLCLLCLLSIVVLCLSISAAHKRPFTLQHAFGFNICVCIAMSEANGLDACEEYWCGNGVVETTPNITEVCDGSAINSALVESMGLDPDDFDPNDFEASWNCDMSKLLQLLKTAFFFFFDPCLKEKVEMTNCLSYDLSDYFSL